MRFLFFIIANAMLFIRPSEFVQELEAWELYRYAILACLIVSLPVLLEQFSLRFPGVPPLAGCVLGLLPAAILSNLVGGNSENLGVNAIELLKQLVYYLLLLALVNSISRLRRFLYWLTVFCAVLAFIAVVRYHADLALPAAPPQASAEKSPLHGTYVVDYVPDTQTGDLVAVQRMCGTGIFNDPNDLALALLCAMPLCLYWMADPARRASRPIWLGLLLLCGYALLQTHSRGGFLALMAGVATFLHVRYGGKKTMLLGALALPVLLIAFAGRMTSISASDGTGQSRIQLWSDGLAFFQSAPLFGIGMGNYGQYSSHVAHNSFIHSYTELGLIGGTLFLGAFYFALRGMFLLKPAADGVQTEIDPELRRLHPYLLALIVAYTVGILFLSRNYVVPTYMILGLATVYQRLHTGQMVVVPPVWSRLMLPRLVGVSFGFLIVSYTFVRLFAN